jgi:hypothetical protein
MKIARVDLEPVTLRKEDPKWRFALGASPVTEGVIVTIGGVSIAWLRLGDAAYGRDARRPYGSTHPLRTTSHRPRSFCDSEALMV